jgi:hypothetical protein
LLFNQVSRASEVFNAVEIVFVVKSINRVAESRCAIILVIIFLVRYFIQASKEFSMWQYQYLPRSGEKFRIILALSIHSHLLNCYPVLPMMPWSKCGMSADPGSPRSTARCESVVSANLSVIPHLTSEQKPYGFRMIVLHRKADRRITMAISRINIWTR